MAKRRGGGSDALQRVREKLSHTDIGGGKYWKPDSGRNVIRILPGVGDMGDAFWQDVGRHYIPDGPSFTCLAFTIDEACPICEAVDELYRDSDPNSKALARELNRQKQFWMNVIDRNNESRGVQIFTPGPMIFGQISGLVMDPDYGAIYDEEEGMDIIITKTGEGMKTRYTVNARPKFTPLSDDPDLMDEWLESARDLTPLELSDDPDEDGTIIAEAGGSVAVTVLPYERLRDEFTGASEKEGDAGDTHPFPDDEEEEEEDDNIREVIRRKRSSRTSRRSRRR